MFAAAAAFGGDPSVSQEIVVNIEVNVGLLGFSGEGAWQFELNAGELHSLLERLLPEQPATKLRSPTLYAAVLAELDGIGWGRLLALNEARDELALQVQDGAGRSQPERPSR